MLKQLADKYGRTGSLCLFLPLPLSMYIIAYCLCPPHYKNGVPGLDCM